MENRAERDRQPPGLPRRGERSEAIQHRQARHGKCPKVPPGSTLDRGMRGEKRTDDRPCMGGTLNSGGPESVPAEAVRRPGANGDQRQEDAVWTIRESDPPIVVRDGNTGHTAKGRAGRQRKQSTHLRTRILLVKGVKLPACIGSGFRHTVSESVPCARLPEEPGAVVPHAGICEGGTGQPVSLPQSLKK